MKKVLLGLATIAAVGFNTLNAQGAAPAVHTIIPYLAVDVEGTQAVAVEELVRFQRTRHDFNGEMQSQIIVGGIPTYHNPYPRVNVGTSIGHYIAKQAITQSNFDEGNNIVIGYIMGFNHYGITQGYLESKYDNENNVYDSSAYIR